MTPQELQVQKKREVESKSENTMPARMFMPAADIYESQDALTVIMEMPGVQKDDVAINVENDILAVEGRIAVDKYDGLQPLYTEYNIGHYARSFRLSNKIDQSQIAAEMKDGVLSLRLPKAQEAKPRTIKIS